MGPTPTATPTRTSSDPRVQLAKSRTRKTILADLAADARGALFLARILARFSVRDAPVHTCKRVLYTISYRVHFYKITR